jgi:hypothetical protein
MVRTMDRARITAEAQWRLPSEIDHIIEVPDIGTAVRITSGSRDIGAGGATNTSGSAATMSYADIDRANCRGNRITPPVEPSPTAPNENERRLQDSLTHTVRFGGN